MAANIDQISSSIDALMQEFYTITHNLANVNTVGYKRRCNAFSKLLESVSMEPQSYAPGSIEVTTALDFSQGDIVRTGRALDLALYGKGFFVIETPNGPLYTRNGTFFTNSNGRIVDSQGRTVAGQGGALTIPANVAISQVVVSRDGTISAGGTTIGRLRIVDFKDNESKLVSVGQSCFQMPDPDVRAVAAENVVVKQGYQEASNVKMIEELVDMIMVTRLYEANMKLLEANNDTSSALLSAAVG